MYLQDTLEEFGVYHANEVVTCDTAANNLAMFNLDDFPYVAGKCVNHILQLGIKV